MPLFLSLINVFVNLFLSFIYLSFIFCLLICYLFYLFFLFFVLFCILRLSLLLCPFLTFTLFFFLHFFLHLCHSFCSTWSLFALIAFQRLSSLQSFYRGSLDLTTVAVYGMVWRYSSDLILITSEMKLDVVTILLISFLYNILSFQIVKYKKKKLSNKQKQNISIRDAR